MKPIALLAACAVIALTAEPAAAQSDDQWQYQSSTPLWQPYETESDYQNRRVYEDFQRRQDALDMRDQWSRGSQDLAPITPLRRSRENYGYDEPPDYR